MESQSTLKVNVEGQNFSVSSSFAKVSDYVKGLQALGFDDDEEIIIDSISIQTFKDILEFYEICNYTEVSFKTPIKTNDLKEVFQQKICLYLQKYNVLSGQFKKLIKGTQLLGCTNLLKVLAARLAAFIYFQDSKQSFQEKQKQLNIKVNVQFEDSERFKKLYPFMNN